MKDHGKYQSLVNAAEQVRAIISDDHTHDMIDYIDSILEEALEECKSPEEK